MLYVENACLVLLEHTTEERALLVLARQRGKGWREKFRPLWQEERSRRMVELDDGV